jgi:hypothetical protein
MKPVDGMWEFPMFSELPAGSFQRIGSCRHTITHHRLDVSVYEGELADRECEWKDAATVPMSSLMQKILNVMIRRADSPPQPRRGGRDIKKISRSHL